MCVRLEKRKRFYGRGVGWMRPHKFRPNQSIGRRVIAFPTFPIWQTSAISNIIIFYDHVAFIEVLICCCVPNFIKTGSRVRPPYAHNCRMFNVTFLGTAVAMATKSWGTCRGHDGICDRPSWISVGPLIGEL